MKFPSIGDTNIFGRSFNELLSEFLFKLWAGSIFGDILEVFVEFELIELFLLEFFESLLNGDLGLVF